jgi:chorismate lyase
MAAQLPLWRLLLLSDGSVTRHLQLLTGSAVKVDCLAMEPVPAGADGLPPVVHEMLTAPLLQREVLLRHKDAEGRALVHATSWWNAAAASSNLRDPSQPIWVSLTQAHKELYREIQTVQLGESAALEQHFGTCGPFWGRLYLFWHGGQPLTVIHEVFSPHLAEYLLPSKSDSVT